MKKWYVLQIYAGYEAEIEADLNRNISQSTLHDKIGKILIPSVKMKEYFTNEESDQQLFPGYMLIELEENPSPEVINLLTKTERVLKFLGGKTPFPLSNKEVNKIFDKVEGRVIIEKKMDDFVINSEISIVEGPFSGFVGIIEKINSETESLTVMVSIFGRMTPVELKFNQIKK